MGATLKHGLRNSIVASAAFVLRVGDLLNTKKGPRVRVLVFHDVTNPLWFKTVIAYLERHYNVITPHEFFTSVFATNKINVLVTFDDGYASWIKTCAPILKEYDCHALFFINSGLLDAGIGSPQEVYCRERLLLQTQHAVATWDDIRALVQEGHTIGGHTTTHARLSELQRAYAMKEILDDKVRIETQLGCTLSDFAYPFGTRTDFVDETETLVREAGYVRAYTTIPGFVTEAAGTRISRLCLEEGMSIRALSDWVEGGYDIYTKLKHLCVG